MEQSIVLKAMLPVSIIVFGLLLLSGLFVLANSIEKSSLMISSSIRSSDGVDVDFPSEITLIHKGPGSFSNNEIEVKLTQ